MKKLLFISVLIVTGFMISCGSKNKKQDTFVLIKTDLGDIKVKLYDDTPLHKNNFVKLANEGFYNGLIFHRVIENFMIQGGDPHSKNVDKKLPLGAGGPGYTVPAEIKPNHFHKRGALAAARLGNSRNPERASSGSQFYLVQGKVFRPGELDTMIQKINSQRKNEMLRAALEANNSKLLSFKKKDDSEGFNNFIIDLREEVDSTYNASHTFSLTDEEKEVYTTIGGYPSLDGEYTVFGEVVEGMDVVDKIAAVKTNRNNRPEKDVHMKMKVLK